MLTGSWRGRGRTQQPRERACGRPPLQRHPRMHTEAALSAPKPAAHGRQQRATVSQHDGSNTSLHCATVICATRLSAITAAALQLQRPARQRRGGGRAGGPTNGANGWSDSASQARNSRVSSVIKPIRGEQAPSRAAQAARQAQRGADLPGRRTGPASCAAGLAPAQRQARDARQPECRVRLPSERPASALPVIAGNCNASVATSIQASAVARQTQWRFAWRARGRISVQ